MESGTVTASILDQFLQDDNNIDKLQRFVAKLYRKIVQPEDLARILYSKSALDNLSDTLRVHKHCSELILIHYITEQAFKRGKFNEFHEALLESGNDHVVQEISKWIQTEVEKQAQELRGGAVNANNTLGITHRSTVQGLFVATKGGLIALNLQTLENTTITSKHAHAVGVNQYLNKVYWWEENCQIMRSNFNGSDQEVIVPATGDRVVALAVDDTSGNVYFGLWSSAKVKICNALGKNCTELPFNSSLLQNPSIIALDLENSVMYWTGVKPYSGFVRANMDGTNATIIDGGFTQIYGITLDKNSSEVVYWTDWEERSIGTINVNGGNKRKLIQLEPGMYRYGIQVDDEKIYFRTINGVNCANKHTGGEMKTIFNSSVPVYDLALFNATV